MVPFWVPIIIRGLIRGLIWGTQKGTIILTIPHIIPIIPVIPIIPIVSIFFSIIYTRNLRARVANAMVGLGGSSEENAAHD